MGRPLLNYEMTSYIVLDPDSLETFVFKDAIGQRPRKSVPVKISVAVAEGLTVSDEATASVIPSGAK